MTLMRDIIVQIINKDSQSSLRNRCVKTYIARIFSKVIVILLVRLSAIENVLSKYLFM